jgi:hypothetical protein
MLATLRQFVEAESPSLEKVAADRCCGLIAAAWRNQDVKVERLAQKHRGDHLRISYGPGNMRPAGQLLVLGHYDTVYSSGTLRKMRQNLGWAIGYNSVALPIAAGVFEPAFGLVLRPEIAALSMSGSSFLVAVNALLLRRLRLPSAAADAP